MTQKTFKEFLQKNFSEEVQVAVEVETQLVRLAVQAADLAERSGLSRREIATRMGASSPSTVQRIIKNEPLYNPTVETLVRFVIACGFRPEMRLVGETMAERLRADVLELDE